MTSSGIPGLVAEPGPAAPARPDRRHGSVRARVIELARFGSVGTVAFVVDMGTYNLLRFGPVDLLHAKPLTARILAVVIATLVSWLGNRHWTFADRRTERQGRELALFTIINVLGIGITVGTLALSHYVLDLTGPLADNVANVIGIGLGTIVRYLGYQLFVFTGTATVPVALADVGHRARAHATEQPATSVDTLPLPRAATTDGA